MEVASRVKTTCQMPLIASKAFKGTAACEAIVLLKISNAESLVGVVGDAHRDDSVSSSVSTSNQRRI